MIDFGYQVGFEKPDKCFSERLRGWRNHPMIRKWCRQWDELSQSDQAAWFERTLHDSSMKMYVIQAEGDVVGMAGLTSIDLINRRAEFSLYIGPEFQGRGFGRASLKTLLAHGFKNMGLHSIWGETFDGNPALTMFFSLGFKREGIRRESYFREGQFIDSHLIGILAREWKP